MDGVRITSWEIRYSVRRWGAGLGWERKPSGNVRKHQINCHWARINVRPQLPCISYVLCSYWDIWALYNLACLSSSTSLLARKVALPSINTGTAGHELAGGVQACWASCPVCLLCVSSCFGNKLRHLLDKKNTLHVPILSSLFTQRACGRQKPEPRFPDCSSNLWTMLPPMALPFIWPGVFTLLPGIRAFLKKSVLSHKLFDMPQWVLLTFKAEKMSHFILLHVPCRQLGPNLSLHQCWVSERCTGGITCPSWGSWHSDWFPRGKSQQHWVLFLYPEL